MKRLLAALLLCLLLTACAKKQPSPVGVWVNAGQYSESQDFVETLTLTEDGRAVVHLEYRGADYATLEGTWTVDGDALTVDFTDPNTKDRTYTFTVSGDTLTLTGGGKSVEYTRKQS